MADKTAKIEGDTTLLTSPTINPPEISIIVPCYNEEQAIQICIDKIKKVIKQHNLKSEVIFVNNASTDNSLVILEHNLSGFKELKILNEERRGYGSAYIKGLAQVQGQYICMADCDDTYDFGDIPLFIKKLKDHNGVPGADLVVGNRFEKKLPSGIMPWHHQYIGNPFLSFLVKLFFKVKINDIHCGARAIRNTALQKLDLRTHGMEFASEMIIKCAKLGMKIEEIPITYRIRIGTSKLNSFSDGWRHLRLILRYSPLISSLSVFMSSILGIKEK
ncbi:MAG: glycosyltransferase family 2 protein [Candidatus Pacebacteria bacterium]|nr:glycosyltransferase family 2 protein [Candidatus Paceibacterota bacterium]